ncbi:MAG: hypothetical protein GXO89_09310 [Chlorobi bacterium]|nr:hypothetical protein [Chlorobiota bacterium]
MNKSITIVVILLGIALSAIQGQTGTVRDSLNPKEENGFTVQDEEYTLHFKIENTNKQEPALVIVVELYNGSHYISPLAKGDFTGKFNLDLGSFTHLGFEGEIKENPRSTEEFSSDPFVKGTVNWVRVNSTYKQDLQVKSQEDFEVFGSLRFTIEPRCTLEVIRFTISFKDGELKITYPKC